MENLTQAEQDVFKDPAIAAAYAAWTATVEDGDKTGQPASRKAFLMRIRFLLQQGKLPD